MVRFNQSLNDERAVSPVIGVILMVAITVILAAIIGTAVLGIGSDINTDRPSASFSGKQDTAGNYTITHTGGDVINEDLSVRYTAQDGTSVDGTWAAPIRAGSEYTTTDPVASDSTIRVVWTSGGQEYVLAQIQAS